MFHFVRQDAETISFFKKSLMHRTIRYFFNCLQIIDFSQKMYAKNTQDSENECKLGVLIYVVF